jgi:biphenyl 2,3-dioxygenase beta subunit
MVQIGQLSVTEDLLAEMLLKHEVDTFLLNEAALLDANKYSEWIQLFTEDVHYFMPLRRTRSRRELDKEFTKPGEMAFIDDDRALLEMRVAKFTCGSAWAEDPPSRTRHLITNIRILENEDNELTVESYFHLYRTRLKSEEDSWIGRRVDTLRRVGAELRISERTVYLDQTVLLSRNLSNLF